ncbi:MULTISPECIES: FecCD family ABC transporter permease [Streptomyces]
MADESTEATGTTGTTGTTGAAERAAAAVTRTAAADAVARVGRLHRGRRVRFTVVCLVLAVVALAALLLSLTIGDIDVPLADVLAVLTGGGDPGSRFVIHELRLPRALLALVIGCCFGLSGAVFQALLRNPLASPDVIGVTSGASAAAVLSSMAFGLSGLALSGGALAGALLAGTLIYVLAWRGGVSGGRFVLIGIGVGTGLISLRSYLMTRAEVTEAQNAFLWLTGSLNGRSWVHLWPLLGCAAVLVPLTLIASRGLGPLQLGDDAAGGLGARVERSRLALLACATALVGVGTAAAGPIGFVAFVSPPIARRLLPGHGAALVPSALTGAALVCLADFAAQHMLPSTQLPVGVVTSIIGAPYLLWLLSRANRVGRGG